MRDGACRESIYYLGLWGIVDIPVWLHSDTMILGIKTEEWFKLFDHVGTYLDVILS